MLQALIEARGSGRAVVLLTPLDGSLQRLLDAEGLALLDHTDPGLASVARQSLAQDRTLTTLSQGVETMITPHNPRLRMLIVGAVHIAEVLARLARETGYDVTVLDPRTAFLRPARFAGVHLLAGWPQQELPQFAPDARTAVVLLTHDPKIDDPALVAVLGTPAFYVGALGSTRTHARRLERLEAQGLAREQLARIHGPAGLSIGARTPAEIAVSILAQVTQQLRSPAS